MSIDDTYTEDQMRRAPKVLLHDHLDGGLRPATVIDLARETGYDHLPTTDADELAAWFTAGAAWATSCSTRGLRPTVGVMQTPDALERARRMRRGPRRRRRRLRRGPLRPEQHLEGGLSLDQVVEAVLAGIRQGQDGRPITVGLLLSAMRTAANSADIADLVLRHRDAGVVGFDIAGSESGSPPSRHLDAPPDASPRRTTTSRSMPARRSACRRSGRRCSCAGRSASATAAHRRRHQVGPDGKLVLGRLASFVRDRRVPLDVPDVERRHGRGGQPRRAPDRPAEAAPLPRLVNTDNRLMSGVSMSSEMQAMVDTFGWGWDDLEWVTLNAMKSAFRPFDHRLRIINEQIKPGYAALKASSSGRAWAWAWSAAGPRGGARATRRERRARRRPRRTGATAHGSTVDHEVRTARLPEQLAAPAAGRDVMAVGAGDRHGDQATAPGVVQGRHQAALREGETVGTRSTLPPVTSRSSSTSPAAPTR